MLCLADQRDYLPHNTNSYSSERVDVRALEAEVVFKGEAVGEQSDPREERGARCLDPAFEELFVRCAQGAGPLCSDFLTKQSRQAALKKNIEYENLMNQ